MFLLLLLLCYWPLCLLHSICYLAAIYKIETTIIALFCRFHDHETNKRKYCFYNEEQISDTILPDSIDLLRPIQTLLGLSSDNLWCSFSKYFRYGLLFFILGCHQDQTL